MRSLIGIPSPCMVLVSFLSFHLISWGLGTYQRKDVFLFFFFWGSWAIDEAFSGYYDSSSPDGAASSAASKNIVSERNRRKRLNERLFALRAVVPNISKVMTLTHTNQYLFIEVLYSY
jgi:hypothetical protein